MCRVSGSQAFFAGDAPQLLDMLVKSSAQKPAAQPHLDGRQLVRWEDDTCTSNSSGLLEMPLEPARCVRQAGNCSSRRACVSPPTSACVQPGVAAVGRAAILASLGRGQGGSRASGRQFLPRGHHGLIAHVAIMRHRSRTSPRQQRLFFAAAARCVPPEGAACAAQWAAAALQCGGL